MKFQTLTLPNGLRIVALPMKERLSVAIGIWVGIGGRHETNPESGVSHFLEHIVFKGTHTRSAKDIKESIEGAGGSLNAFTSEEYTCFLAKTSSRHFDNAFDVLADMVLNATITEVDVTKERTVILEEIKMTQDQPANLVEELLSELVWPNHSLGRPLAGTLESVGALTVPQIRGYRDRYYRPSRITVVAAGDIQMKHLVELSHGRFGSIAKGSATPKSDRFRCHQTKPAVKLFHKDTAETHLALAVHALPKSHPDECAMDVLSILLGGNMSSRLFHEVREERGLAYDIGSSVRKYNETGIFGVEAGVDGTKFLEATKVILSELHRVTSELVKPGELQRAKDFYLGQLELGLENSMNQMLWAGESMMTTGKVRNVAEVQAKVSRVQLHDLRRVARHLFRDKHLNLAVVGPDTRKYTEKLRSLLTF